MALIALLALIVLIAIAAGFYVARMLRLRPAAQYDVLKMVWLGGVLDGIAIFATLSLFSVLIAMELL
jgi:hypothetical protein